MELMEENEREELGTKDFYSPAGEGASLCLRMKTRVQGQVGLSFGQPCLAEEGPCLWQGC